MTTEELKTLKDIDVWNHYEGDVGNKYEMRKTGEQILDELKAEAVKWVKYDLQRISIFDYKTKNIILRWAKRFNITKEDLK